MTAELIKISAFLIIAAAFSALIKQYRPEIGVGLVVAVSVAVMLFLFGIIKPVLEKITELFEKTGVDAAYLTAALKALGIAYVSGFVADTCRDFGQTSLASKAEFAGRCAILVISLPLMSAVLDVALELIGV